MKRHNIVVLKVPFGFVPSLSWEIVSLFYREEELEEKEEEAFRFSPAHNRGRLRLFRADLPAVETPLSHLLFLCVYCVCPEPVLATGPFQREMIVFKGKGVVFPHHAGR